MDKNLVEERRRDLWLSISSISITLTLHPHLNSCPVDWKYSRCAQDLDPLVHVSSHLAKTELTPGYFTYIQRTVTQLGLFLKSGVFSPSTVNTSAGE